MYSLTFRVRVILP